ncbi:hypothetical protein [uncultured Jannaschia sp.]|uniref:hypothetical protein n=1 Tax=uncultured Jannaschia sp. TaxID=293347 RepID=UPI00263760EE|nr:hypothetical protein [uncultured Jannaschia sp.]
MRIALLPLALVAALTLADAAGAACYADYKAKKDDPLRLHYGVIEVGDGNCSAGAAASVIRGRLGDGWQLLEVESVFGPEGLEQRKGRAGEFFLRY